MLAFSSETWVLTKNLICSWLSLHGRVRSYHWIQRIKRNQISYNDDHADSGALLSPRLILKERAAWVMRGGKIWPWMWTEWTLLNPKRCDPRIRQMKSTVFQNQYSKGSCQWSRDLARRMIWRDVLESGWSRKPAARTSSELTSPQKFGSH